jgi:demethylmenaquinone methyltransferase / 2-methoxy-6-polyprenyl-1,4-benzoquinol methylase
MQDAGFVRQAFAKIAGRYVLTNHVLSMGIDVLWRRRTAAVVAELRPTCILDLATGSGDLAVEVQRQCPQAWVLGADFSPPMMSHAAARGMKELIVADGMRLPIKDGAFDVLTVAFGLRNMASWPGALREMQRVLKPGGHLVVLDFSTPKSPGFAKCYDLYLRLIMPKIAGLLTGERGAYEYLCTSIHAFPSGVEMEKLMLECGFKSAKGEALSFGIASLYVAEKGI